MNTSHIIKAAGNNADDLDITLDNPEGNSIRLTINISDEDVGGGAGAMVVTIQAVDGNGIKTTLLASASLAAVAATVLQVGPGLPTTANVSANAAVPRRLNININHTNANPMAYSVGADLIG